MKNKNIQCLHNKTGQKIKHGDTKIQVPNEGDCYNCTYNPIENKKCRKFFPIIFVTCNFKI